MRKVNKYVMYFNNLECDMSANVEISKEQFDRQIAFLSNQIVLTKDYECPVEKLKEYYTENAHCDIHTYLFICGTATTELSHIRCKEGYTFKK